MHVKVDISPGELIDKLSILKIKLEMIKDPVKLTNIDKENDLLIQEYENMKMSLYRQNKDDVVKELGPLSTELLRINRVIWNTEDKIRECEKDKNFGKDFIELARGIYQNNDERSRIKKKINKLCDSLVIEEKSYSEYQ